MKNVALIWELGAGLYHVDQLKPIYRAVQTEEELTPKLLVKSPQLFSESNGFSDSDVYACPKYNHALRNFTTFHYADILFTVGYHSPHTLISLINAWLVLLRSLEIKFAVTDYSPTAILACRILGIPVLTIGGGYFTPPNIPSCPFLVPQNLLSNQTLVTQSRRREEHVLHNVNTVLTSFQKATVASIGEIYSQAQHMVMELKSVDNYGTHRAAKDIYVGALRSGDAKTARMDKDLKGCFDLQQYGFATMSQPTVFVYIKSHTKYFKAFMDAVRELDHINWLVFVSSPDKNQELPKYAHCYFSTKPLPVEEILPQVDAVMCHAGRGTIMQSLLQKKPLCLMPEQLEQMVNTTTLCNQGVATRISSTFCAQDLKQQISKLLESSKTIRQLKKLSQEITHSSSQDSTALVSDYIKKTLALSK